MDCEFELEEFRCSDWSLKSSYTRLNYLRRVRRSLFDLHFLMFFSKDFSNKVFHSLSIFYVFASWPK
ncbi:hypothetical protein Hanom_Chr01g00059181 [Helianthus anomalus]